MKIQETFINQTKGYQFGESEPYEPYTDNIGKLFRNLQREYGRCVSAMYIDKADGSIVKTGWVFEKRMQYEDTGRYGRKAEFYTREVWVQLLQDNPEYKPTSKYIPMAI